MRQRPRRQIDWSALDQISDPCDPERRLLLAVLERAIRDALGIKGVAPPELEKCHARDARCWLGLGETYRIDTDPEPWSCQWLCSHLQIDSRHVHDQLSEALSDPHKESTLRDHLYSRALNRSFRRYTPGRKMWIGKTAG